MMNVHVPQSMTVDEYLAWAMGRPGRYELINGAVRKMSPEVARHAHAKHAAIVALKAAIKRAGVACFAMPDGMTVRINPRTAFEPDALVYGAPRVSDVSVEIPNPVIVVEIGSPSTGSYDAGFKLSGYMSLPSIHHVLLINAAEKLIIYHRRAEANIFTSTTVTDDVLKLDPPGLEIPVAEFFDFD